MKKLINAKDWNWLCCAMCLVMTMFNIVMTLKTNEKCTHATLTMREYMGKLIELNSLKDSRFIADYPDYETYEGMEWNEFKRKRNKK